MSDTQTQLIPSPQPELPLKLEPYEVIVWKRFLLAFAEVGSCLTSMGNVLLQGQHRDTSNARGSIALGLERAAQYCRGGSLGVIYPPAEHQPGPNDRAGS